MGKKTDVDAIAVIRRIRDRQAELLRDKSDEEIIEFFRKAGEAFRKRPRTKSKAPANRVAGGVEPPAPTPPRHAGPHRAVHDDGAHDDSQA